MTIPSNDFQIPNRQAAPLDRARLATLAENGSSAASPAVLARGAIVEAPNVFQPRFDSMVYAVGRSEAHIADLARVAGTGTPLDPVTVISFGDEWHLVDGHHRLAAYGVAGWTGDIPVRVLHSPLTGTARVDWAIEQSFADNKKNRLNMTATDKVDGAWQCIAQRRDGSKKQTREAFGVSDGAVASMRRVRKELETAGVPATSYVSWRTAQNELRRLQGETTAPRVDGGDRLRRETAKRMTPLMDLKLSPKQLAEALETFEPGIVAAMAEAWRQRIEPSDDDLGI